MNGDREIRQAIEASRSAGRPVVSAYVTAGFPDRRGFADLLTSIAAEADLVEVGVPFSDPMADGVTIQRSSRAALEQGVTLAWILDEVSSRRCRAPLVLMSYLNPLLAYGLDALVSRAREAGVAGLIVPDLPWEECHELREFADDRGLALIQLVTPVTPDDRLRRLCAGSRGFVYAVTVAGITGGAAYSEEAVGAYLDRVGAASPLPVLAGFGIRTAEQLRAIGAHADGAVVGSALIEALERGEDPVEWIRGLRGERPRARGGGS